MAKFLIAYNPATSLTGELSGEWIMLDAKDKSDALSKTLDIPVPGIPKATLLDESRYIYILEVKPEDKVDITS